MDDKGYPVWEGGHMVMNSSDKQVKVEEHTLNISIEDIPDGGVKTKLRDSFYHNTWSFEDKEIVWMDSSSWH